MIKYTIRGNLPTNRVKPHQKTSPRTWEAIRRMREEWHILGIANRVPSTPLKRYTLTYIYRRPTAEVRRKELMSGMSSRDRLYVPVDRDNMSSAAKPALDGLRDASLIADDTHKNVVSVSHRRLPPDPNTPRGYLEIVIEEVKG
ncbi:MAG: hypothetical protein ABFD60_04295 [Bryobacteraceae bacterium]